MSTFEDFTAVLFIIELSQDHELIMNDIISFE
jgi:hypothetical protein